jgi:predicted negative regulator of RcsB-dependent stress response
MRGFLAALVIVFLIALGLGLYFDWFSFKLNRNEEGKASGVSFQVDRERIAKDTERASQAVKNLGQKISGSGNGQAATHTVKGTLMNVDQKDRQLTLKTSEDKAVEVVLPQATKIRRNDVEVNLDGLMPGDRLEVIYRDEDGKNVADKVTVLPGV